MTTPALQWTWARFDALAVHDLYDALALRSNVFVIEQNCPFLDADGVDPQCWHLLGRDAGGMLLAYLRVVDPGVKYAEPSIGRVMSALAVRGTGVGRVLTAEGVRRCQLLWPGRGIRISAQARLERFYSAFGFAGVGETYLEDNIPHLEMLMPALAAAAADVR